MSDNGNTDATAYGTPQVVPADAGAPVTQMAPLVPAQQGEPVTSDAPVQVAQDVPPAPSLPEEQDGGLPVGATDSPETPRNAMAPVQADPRNLDAPSGDVQASPREEALAPLQAQPRNLDAPSGDSQDSSSGNGDSGGGNSGDSGGSDGTASPRGSVYVDTGKLTQGIPTLDAIMRQMYAISNDTANALNAYQLDKGDSYGEAYSTTADPISSQILEGLSAAGKVFGDTAEGARQMVHNYNVTEENAVNTAGDLLTRPHQK